MRRRNRRPAWKPLLLYRTPGFRAGFVNPRPCLAGTVRKCVQSGAHFAFPIRYQGDPHMKFKDFAKAGHAPTLFSAFLYFDMSFMVWVLLGPLGVHIAKDLGPVSFREGHDGRHPRPFRRHHARVHGPAGGQHRRQARRTHRPGHRARCPTDLLDVRLAKPASGLPARHLPGRGRRFVRRGASPGLPLVSAGSPRPGPGHRRRRQFRNRVRGACSPRCWPTNSDGPTYSAWCSSPFPSP